MIDLDYEGLRKAALGTEPFPHIVLPHFVRPAALPRVIADLPTLGKRGSIPPDALHLGPAAAELVRELEGPTLKSIIGARFGLDLSDAPTMLTLRGWTDDRDGKIHTDSRAKRVTILLYLNPERGAFSRHEGCLRLLRSPDNLDDYTVEVPPVDGTLLVFPNGPTAWHGHKTFTGQRYSIQLNYMTTDAKARGELRRHRFSAFVKRLSPAA